MQKFILSSFAFLIAGLLTLCAQSTAMAGQKGQKYLVETTSKVSNIAEVMGQSMENNSDVKTSTLYEITDAGPEGLALQSSITKMLVAVSAMGQEMNFDSDKKDNEGPIAEGLNKMMNKPKNISLDLKGTIIKQDSLEEDVQGLLLGISGGKQLATELFIPALMGIELKTGDSYPELGNVKTEKFSSVDSGQYKIIAVENGLASVSYSGTQTISAIMEQMGMEMTSNSNNTVKSELQVDIKTGMVLAKATVVESSVSIDVGGMTIPATGKTVTTVKITAIQ